MLINYIFFFLFFVKLSFAQVNPKPKLIIGSYDLSPLFITSGDYQNKGILDFYLAYIYEELSQKYSVDVLLYPKTRAIKNLVKFDNYCVYPLYKSDSRDKLGNHTQANFGLLGSYVIMAKKNTFPDPEKLPDKKLGIRHIFSNYPNMTLGLEQDSNHGKIVQTIIDNERKKHPEKFFHRPGVGSHYALYRMLKSNRVQFILILPSELYWIQKIKNKEIDFDFSLYEIKENNSNAQEAYSYCSKTQFGKQVIEDINAIHNDPKKHKILLEKMKIGADFWLPPKDAKKFMNIQEKLYKKMSGR